MCGVPMMILVTGLLGARIAPDASWATFPLAVIVLGTASASIPAAYVNRFLGRRGAGYCGFGVALLACGLGFWAAQDGSFLILLAACAGFGVANAFMQQLRFAALESVAAKEDYGPALSVLMLGGLAAAFFGPEIGAVGKDLVASPHGFAGSFVLLAGAVCIAALIFSFFRQRVEIETEANPAPSRPLFAIVRTRAFFLAAATAALGYATMSFVMTATPVTMYEVCGYGLTDTKRVIQVHIFSMFLPSVFSGLLIKRFGAGRVMLGGALAYAIVLVIGLQGRELVHFWGALIVLGVGWNFLFTSGTTLLPLAYRGNERFRAQAANDFLVFGSQAAACLSAGWFVFNLGWDMLLISCIPLVAGAVVLAVLQLRREGRSI